MKRKLPLEAARSTQSRQKRVRLHELEASPSASPSHDTPLPALNKVDLNLNFHAEEEDHCETDLKAYEDLVLVVETIARSLGKKKADIKLYDPYFCNGSVKKNLAKLGFRSVHNENEDFYGALESGRIPPFDILVTNPPYSGDHIHRFVTYASSCRKPWMMLAPSFVREKKWFEALNLEPFFICPSERYAYWCPTTNERKLAPPNGSPFSTFWYVFVPGAQRSAIELAWAKVYSGKDGVPVFARDSSELPTHIKEKKHRKVAKKPRLLDEDGVPRPRDQYEIEKLKKKKRKKWDRIKQKKVEKKRAQSLSAVATTH